MKKIQSSTVQRNLGEVLTRASRGERFLVTQYGRPFVVIGPPPTDVPDGLEESEIGRPVQPAA